MVRNVHKDNMKARQFIDKRLSEVIYSDNTTIRTSELIRMTLINYPVSEYMVKKFIIQFYIEPKLLIEEDGIIKKNMMSKVGDKNGN